MTRLSRRQAMLALTLAAAAACAPKPVLAEPAEPLSPINERIGALERRYNAYVGLFGADLDGGRSISHRGQEAFAMCSTFKGYASARGVADGRKQRADVGSEGLYRSGPRSSRTRRELSPVPAAT